MADTEDTTHDQASVKVADQERWHSLLYANHHDTLAIETLAKEYKDNLNNKEKSNKPQTSVVTTERTTLTRQKQRSFYSREKKGGNFEQENRLACIENNNKNKNERRFLVALVKNKKRATKKMKNSRNKENSGVKKTNVEQRDDELSISGKSCEREDVHLPEVKQASLQKRKSKTEIKRVVVQMPQITIDKPGIINDFENRTDSIEKFESTGDDEGNYPQQETQENQEQEILEQENILENVLEDNVFEEENIQIFSGDDFDEEVFTLPGEGRIQVTRASLVDFNETSQHISSNRKALRRIQSLNKEETCYFCRREKMQEEGNLPEVLMRHCSNVRLENIESHQTETEATVSKNEAEKDCAVFTMEELCQRHRTTIKNIHQVLYPRGFRGSIHTCPLQRTLDHNARRINLQKYNSVDHIYKVISEERKKQREAIRRRTKSETDKFLDCERLKRARTLTLPPIVVVPAEHRKTVQRESTLERFLRETRPNSNDSGIGE